MSACDQVQDGSSFTIFVQTLYLYLQSLEASDVAPAGQDTTNGLLMETLASEIRGFETI